jgi:hypothetical protein
LLLTQRTPHVLCKWKSCAIPRRRLWPPKGMPTNPRPILAAHADLVVHSINSRSTGIGCRRAAGSKMTNGKGVLHRHRRRRRHPGHRRASYVVRDSAVHPPLRYIRNATIIRADQDDWLLVESRTSRRFASWRTCTRPDADTVVSGGPKVTRMVCGHHH